MPIKPKVWESLAYYARNHQLPPSLCQALEPIIKKAEKGVVPDVVRNGVTATMQTSQTANTLVRQTITIPSPPVTISAPVLQVAFGEMQTTQTAAENLLKQLDQASVLEEVDLDLLEVHQYQMTCEQVIKVVPKISVQCDVVKQLNWHLLLEQKKEAYRNQDPLGLELLDTGYDFLMSGYEDQIRS